MVVDRKGGVPSCEPPDVGMGVGMTEAGVGTFDDAGMSGSVGVEVSNIVGVRVSMISVRPLGLGEGELLELLLLLEEAHVVGAWDLLDLVALLVLELMMISPSLLVVDTIGRPSPMDGGGMASFPSSREMSCSNSLREPSVLLVDLPLFDVHLST